MKLLNHFISSSIENSTMCENVKVAILMLAHDGVKNKCWKKWMEASPEMGMICYISKVDERESMPDSDLGNVFLASQKCLEMPSGWGQASTTLVSIQLLSEGNDLFPNARHFIHVSGRCLPVLDPSSLSGWSELNSSNSVFSNGSGAHFYAVEGFFYDTNEPAWEPTPQPFGSKLKSNGKRYSTNIQTHAQWWILSNSHAKLILNFEKNVGISCLNDLDKLFSSEKLFIFHKKNRRNVVIAPDEYWILLILRLQGVSNQVLFQHVCLYFMENQGDSNPITWTDLDEPRRYYIFNPRAMTTIMHSWMTLRQAVLGSISLFNRIKNSSLFFFRKVEIDDPSFEPWKWSANRVQRISLRMAAELPSVRNCAEMGNHFQKKSTKALFSLYRTLQRKALTDSICLDQRERQRKRKNMQVEINRRNRSRGPSFFSSHTEREIEVVRDS